MIYAGAPPALSTIYAGAPPALILNYAGGAPASVYTVHVEVRYYGIHEFGTGTSHLLHVLKWY